MALDELPPPGRFDDEPEVTGTYAPPVGEEFEFEAERSILGNILYDGARVAEIDRLRPEHFDSESNRRIREAIGVLHDSAQAITVVTVAEQLRCAGRLAQVGGIAYLTELVGTTAVLIPRQLRAHIDIVIERSRARGASAIAKRLAALVQVGPDASRLIADAVADLSALVSPPRSNDTSIVRCLSADEFFHVEDTANLVVPALGICPGPSHGLVGQTWVGKTIVAKSLGMSVALGREAWGTWRVQQGPWLHLDYEQGRRHTKARVRRLARGFGIADNELRGLIESGTIRIAVFPDLRLSSDRAVDHYRRLFDGVRIVTCDSLRVMLGGVDENSSTVRSLMGVLSSASDASGAAVVLIHHAGKTPLDGERQRKEMSRGSSGIVDELQSMFVLSKKKGDAVTMVTHEKDRELGEPVADFGLHIEDVADEHDPKWGLRVRHVDREQMRPAKDASSGAFLKAVQAARDCIADNPGIAGADVVSKRIGMAHGAARAAVKQLIADGEVTPVKGPRNAVRLYLAHMVPQEPS